MKLIIVDCSFSSICGHQTGKRESARLVWIITETLKPENSDFDSSSEGGGGTQQRYWSINPVVEGTAPFRWELSSTFHCH